MAVTSSSLSSRLMTLQGGVLKYIVAVASTMSSPRPQKWPISWVTTLATSYFILQPLTVPDAETAFADALVALEAALPFDFPSPEFPLPWESPSSFEPSDSPRTFVAVAASSGVSSANGWRRSEEHTSELQSQFHLVCRLLLEKKKK